jgi:hypothetical protein
MEKALREGVRRYIKKRPKFFINDDISDDFYHKKLINIGVIFNLFIRKTIMNQNQFDKTMDMMDDAMIDIFVLNTYNFEFFVWLMDLVLSTLKVAEDKEMYETCANIKKFLDANATISAEKITNLQ